MRIVEVELLNWASYRGNHRFNFYSDSGKNGYAIFGINSRGKTSFTDAIQWALYGEAYTKAIIDSNRREIKSKRPLISEDAEEHPLLNVHAFREGDLELFVKIIFDHEKKRWTLIRVMAPDSGSASKEGDMGTSLFLQSSDGDKISGDSVQEFVNNILPKDIKRFFFIDGESVNEYRALISSTQENLEIRKNIEDILNFPVLKRGVGDINYAIEKYVSQLTKVASDSKKNMRLNKKIKEKTAEIKEIEPIIKKAKTELDSATKKIEEIESTLSSMSSTEGLIEKRRGLEEQLSGKKSDLIDAHRNRRKENQYLWLYLLQNELDDKIVEIEPKLEEVSETRYEISRLNSRKSYLEGVLANDEAPCPTCHQLPLPRDEIERKKDIDELKEVSNSLEIAKKHSESLKKYSNSYNSLQKFSTINRIDTASQIEKLIGRLDGEINGIIEEKSQVDELLDGFDETQIINLNSELKKFREIQAEQSLIIRRLDNEIKDLVGERSKFTRDLMGSDGSEETKRIIKITTALRWIKELWVEVLEEYTQETRVVIEERATDTFRALTNNPDGYDRLELNSGFGLKIRDKEGFVVPAPSPGAQQVAAISLIDALRRTSDIEFPILFDTPGASIDQEHRDNIVRHFWAKRDVQLVILAHSGEFRPDEVEKQNKELLARTWELGFDNGINSTVVSPRLV